MSKELEDSAVLPADDDATIDKGDRGGNILSPDLVGYVRNGVLQVPKGQSRVFGDSGERVVESVKVKGADHLGRCFSMGTQVDRDKLTEGTL